MCCKCATAQELNDLCKSNVAVESMNGSASLVMHHTVRLAEIIIKCCEGNEPEIQSSSFSKLAN